MEYWIFTLFHPGKIFTVKSKYLLSILVAILLSTGCANQTVDGSVPTATAVFPTSTFPASPTLSPSETPLPLPPQPTIVPVEGTTSTQINVRVEPSTAGNILGMIPAGSKVEIVGKDPGGNWWQILYPQGADGKGWVTAQYVTTTGGEQVPVVGGGNTNPNGNIAIVQQQINIRSGPGTGFNSLGTLNPQDVVNLTGKDSNGAWFQIEYSAGPDGRGWVNAAFVQARGVENLPIITQAGEVIGTGTPTGVPFTPTPTILPAWMDNDSQSSPIVQVAFDAPGTDTLIYSGDVSSPTGDLEDWIQFTPYNSRIAVTIECNQNDIQINLLENGQLTDMDLACGMPPLGLQVNAGSSYLVHVQPLQSSDSLQYFQYTFKIQTVH